jgi:hypothetical protein
LNAEDQLTRSENEVAAPVRQPGERDVEKSSAAAHGGPARPVYRDRRQARSAQTIAIHSAEVAPVATARACSHRHEDARPTRAIRVGQAGRAGEIAARARKVGHHCATRAQGPEAVTDSTLLHYGFIVIGDLNQVPLCPGSVIDVDVDGGSRRGKRYGGHRGGDADSAGSRG